MSNKMKTILLSILLLFSPYKEKMCLEMDIIILVDISGSLSGYELYMHNAMNSLIDGVETSEDGIRIGVVLFSSGSFVLSPISGDKNVIKSQIKLVGSDNGSTDMTGGFHTCLNEFVKNGRKGVKSLIVVISDGAVNSGESTRLAAQQLKMTGISICTAIILNDTNDKQLMIDISNGCYVESKYENLAKEIEKLDICI
jgi:Mg-chelatase subunit ChlD